MKNRKPSMRDVARLANVSVSAVSLVVRNKPGISEETRGRVREAIAKLGYTSIDAPPSERPPVEITHVYGREEAYEVIAASLADYQATFGEIGDLLNAALPK